MCSFQLREPRTDAPCAWRSLQLCSQVQWLDVPTLARLPLHALTQVCDPSVLHPSCACICICTPALDQVLMNTTHSVCTCICFDAPALGQHKPDPDLCACEHPCSYTAPPNNL